MARKGYGKGSWFTGQFGIRIIIIIISVTYIILSTINNYKRFFTAHYLLRIIFYCHARTCSKATKEGTCFLLLGLPLINSKMLYRININYCYYRMYYDSFD
jgi:hypothetical protein